MATAIGKRVLDKGWLAARSTEVNLTGVELTTTHPPSHQSPWMEAVVPGTVLATLLKNKLVPDPFYGLENELIIDIADSGRQYYTFWFFTTFECKLLLEEKDVTETSKNYRLLAVCSKVNGKKFHGVAITLQKHRKVAAVFEWKGMSYFAVVITLVGAVGNDSFKFFRKVLAGVDNDKDDIVLEKVITVVSTNQYVDLNFRAINYSAEVYLNGRKEVLPKGMFRRHSIDVTDIIKPDGENLLAVLVYPPDHPGRIPPEGGGHEIRKDVAAQYVEGWDWMAPIRDRNTGIWDEVFLSVTGPVKIVDPHLVSSFFDNYKRVYLHSKLELVNKSNWVAECSLNVQVATELEGNTCMVEHLQTQNLSIPAESQVQYTLPELFFYKPKLWWPNGMGEQSLYNVEITVDVRGNRESDSWSQHFGFRKIESHIDSSTGGRLFKVNGQPIFIRGGNWILSDGLLRLSEKRYKTDIKFHADMNLNMIRCWGGGLAERPEFYHYCDIYGLLVSSFASLDTVKLLRNHPSLALWVGGNERAPPDDINTALKKDLQLHPYFESSTDLKYSKEEISLLLDPSEYLDGTRVYVQGAMWDGFANGKGDFTKGPYEIQDPENFFKDDFYSYGFNPEVGSVGTPVAATIRATIPPQGWQIPLFRELPNGCVEEVPNPVWTYHKYIPHSKPESADNQILLYGTPKDLDDFCLKAQLVNFTQYRALLEGWASRMWSKYTGVLIWKTQNPRTGLRGQLYDHLHEQTAGFYGCRCAAEPIHVQLNLATYYVEVVNTTSDEISDVAIEASVWDLEGGCPYYQALDKLTIPSKRTVSIFEMKYPKSETPKPLYFLLLKLYKMSVCDILSRNFYWLHLPGGDFKLLEPYKKNKISLKITSLTFIRGSSYEVRMHIENTSKKPDSRSLIHNNNFLAKGGSRNFDVPSSAAVLNMPEKKEEPSSLQRIWKNFSTRTSGKRVIEISGSHAGVAFFLHFSVHASRTGNTDSEDIRILPVHYSDNYFSLVPGELMTVSLNFEVPQGITPHIRLHGWNYQDGHTVL
ncbi:UNVERIFIED_CONTAM: Mannosylglycoprotein endo-beta-mannosidase [Sesamum calycinum]|uniref:Mannosylglycoprotein endo-beta-mannosidase n=1 Tax=Sesamum calycinum TaxID=2727403 RepID=A0AAW2PQX5_9LAMI